MRQKSFQFLMAILMISVIGQQGLSTGALEKLNVNYMLRGYCYAGTSVRDSTAPGGFGSANNLPKPIEAGIEIRKGEHYLLALPDEETVFDGKYKGMKLLLVNATDSLISFSAQDSRLYIVQEALDKNGVWRPVEYLPSSWCGNSYHQVFLGANKYWEFAAARYHGKFSTRLRFRLDEGKTTIYSNEFDGSVNPGQFTVKQEYKPKGIMDPYNN